MLHAFLSRVSSFADLTAGGAWGATWTGERDCAATYSQPGGVSTALSQFIQNATLQSSGEADVNAREREARWCALGQLARVRTGLWRHLLLFYARRFKADHFRTRWLSDWLLSYRSGLAK